MADVAAVVPVSRDYLGIVLRELRDAGIVELLGRWTRRAMAPRPA